MEPGTQSFSSPLTRRAWLRLHTAGVLGLSLHAQALERPVGPVVLTVTGRVRQTNVGNSVQFDMAMLEAMPQQTVKTRTPWFAQARRFTGPLLRDVLSAAGASGNLMRLIALNDYRVDMPVDDAQRYDVVMARLIDDKPLSVRDKGPLFVIYPFDDKPELHGAMHYARSAWQLRTIEVL
jgi:hypothetical protein